MLLHYLLVQALRQKNMQKLKMLYSLKLKKTATKKIITAIEKNAADLALAVEANVIARKNHADHVLTSTAVMGKKVASGTAACANKSL